MVTTLVAVYLTVHQRILCWPIGMVSVALYAIVFFDARLYAETGLQAVYFALSAFGWWNWARGARRSEGLAVSSLTAVGWGLALACSLVAGLLLGTTLNRFTNASLPFLDSVLSAFSIAAQWMQARKHLEAWLVWLAVDVVYVGMFLYKGLLLTAGLYLVFTFLAVRGFVEWRLSRQATV